MQFKLGTKTFPKGIRRGNISKARLLADGSELKLDTSWVTTDYPDDAFIDFPTSRLTDGLDTVIELELI